MPASPLFLLARQPARLLCSPAVSPAALLSELSCDTAADQHDFRDEDGHGVPPFCPRYCPWVGSNHLLGVADEEGWLSLIDTAKPARDQPRERRPPRPKYSWRPRTLLARPLPSAAPPRPP